MKEFAIGIDYGTLSARAVLARLRDGRIEAAADFAYPHGVMADALPSGRRLAPWWALQHPRDYLDALYAVVPQALKLAGAKGDSVAAVGVDFTCTTCLPTLADGTPLCELERYRDEPNAYVKLWKHHATEQAARLTALAREWKLDWLQNSAGRVSPEWLLPKLLQVKQEAPGLYADTDVYLEAGDWIVWMLCGTLARSESYAAYKNFYRGGYPPDGFFRAADESFAGLAGGRLRGAVLPLSARAGGLTDRMAARLGLAAGTPVCPGQTDSHAGVAAAGLDASGDMLSILGTSACHILQAEADVPATGVAGKAAGGVLPGLVAYEANQSMGELLEWYVANACPASVGEEARARGASPHQLLSEKAAALRPGQSGLIALDWFNGNRCILSDSELSGLVAGLSLRTKPEEIYRALMEGAAYGMREIVENYETQGLAVRRVVAMGGVARKSPLMMQILCDVLGKPMEVSSASEGAALGAAITAAAAGGAFPDIRAAMRSMAQPTCARYAPGEGQPTYGRLYGLYRELHDGFGRDGSEWMHRLSRLKAEVCGESR